MQTYEEGFKNAQTFLNSMQEDSENITKVIEMIDYLKGLSIEYNQPNIAGIADGIWQIISRKELN